MWDIEHICGIVIVCVHYMMCYICGIYVDIEHICGISSIYVG